MKKANIQFDHNIDQYFSENKDRHKFYEAGQLRRAKMRAKYFINAIDKKKALTPTLYQLLEASLILQTTNPKTLAVYLKRTPSTIRSEYQKICTIIGVSQEISD